MRRSRIPAVLGALALASTTTLMLAAPAHAATTVGNYTFYGEADFGQEASGYPAGYDWFFGDDSDGPSLGTATFGPEGLVINDGSGPAGVVQILNQNIETPATPDLLIQLIDQVEIDEGPSATPGAWTFQLPLFAEGTDEFTTLRPSDAGTTSTSIDWITSGRIYDADNTTVLYGPNEAAPLSALLDAIYNTAGNDPTILAWGFWFGPTSEVTLRGVAFDGQVNVFRANPPTRAVAPGSTVTVSDTEDGITFSGTGWFPGTDVYFEFDRCTDETAAGDLPVFTLTGDEVARADGTFEFVVTTEPGLAPGEYCYWLDDNSFFYGSTFFPDGMLPFLTLTVVADVVAEDEELAETGADPAGIMLAGTGLLAAGALALVAVTARRRATV